MGLKGVLGCENVYAVSRDGKVFRISTYGTKPKPIMKPCALREKRGYLIAHFSVDGVASDRSVHRMVWEAFNGPIPKGMQINHLNGIKTDNRLENLEICTPSKNSEHKFRVLNHPAPNNPNPGTRNGAAKLTEDQVRQIRRLSAEGMLQHEIGAMFGISQVMAGKIARRENWRHVTDD
ncbi:HNH endonuclease [Microvirga mediterraneensis]|uniref:HNH endonuclease n=1 Tax=Microvirga mediterraneensis TaxID=2754695 RepID=A0A838BR72_9HYPH|nr:HNH endonuclease [Microvirga mediterraneensis]MBA1156926.1 HNH endonuclease [Microvirga mediterraneensis]